MNIARNTCSTIRHHLGRSTYRNYKISAVNRNTESTQPKIKEEKFDFEDIQVFERVERRNAKIEPFMKNIFVSVFDRDRLAFPEILSKDESETVDKNVSKLHSVFSDKQKTINDKKQVLKDLKMFAATVSLTNGGLAMNNTESLRYLDVISSDSTLSQQLSDHWVAVEALREGLTSDQFVQVLDDITNGERCIALGIKEMVPERLAQADFRTTAELSSQGVWYINGEKICSFHSGFYLVLCITEGNQLKALLVHPGAKGITTKEQVVTFKETPATPLENLSEQKLAQILGKSRLHAATLGRCSLREAMFTCLDYVKPRIFSGKPLSEVPTIRKLIGEALLYIYASESTEYFTAGLMDGFLEPDAEIEMAMCRNFIIKNGLNVALNLLSVPALEQEARCTDKLNEIRYLTSRGENMDSVNMFIAMNGIHHAGKVLANEVKQMRNPLFNPGFIIKKMISDRHQEKDDPKLTLFLAEHLHPTLRPPSEHLEYCVLRMRYACETVMARHGIKVTTALTELNRLAEAATEILAMTAVLARASRAYCIGLRNAEIEMKLAACFVTQSKDRVKVLIKEIDDGEFLNLDRFKLEFGRKVIDNSSILTELPTARTFW